jgi:hypothetical protein
MIATLISLLVVLLILCVIWYIIKIAASQFGAPPFVVQILGLIIGLIFLLYCIKALGIVVKV